ncbi:MAG: (2Fe-2S) ferredoxin domain-containing protein [Myxococcota bacterium]
MSRFKHHIFVCENERAPDNPKGCCKRKGSVDIRLAMKKLVDEHGLRGEVRCNSAGCLDACEYGPTVVVYPDATWYSVPTVADAEEIVREHIIGGRPVERLKIAFKKRQE